MAESTNTLAGLVQMNDANLADLNVSNLLQDTPLLRELFAQPASEGGTLHKYLRETVAAGGAFRDVNTGILNAAGIEELVTVTCKYFDAGFFRDVAIADGFKKGRAAYMAKETMKALKNAFVSMEKQILQDTTADANGFSGFPAQTSVDALADAMCIGAGGSGGRSVWALRTGADDISVIAGNDGQIKFDFDPEQLQFIQTVASATPANQRGYFALTAALGGWFATQYGGAYSLGRLANLDGTSGHTLTDALMMDLWTLFPASRKPNLIVMDQTSQSELQKSRTATTESGKEADMPTMFMGAKIITSDHLNTSESPVS